jgi:hypothetical protein
MSIEMLQNLLGSGQKRQEYGDFVKRFDQGEPHEGISDEEAVSRHDEIASQLSDKDYESSAKQAYEKLSPDQRAELAGMLRQGAQEKNVDLGDFGTADNGRDSDPQHLARMTQHLHTQQSGGLGALLGGGGGGGVGGMLGNPLAKAALAGIAAMAAKKVLHH